MNPASYFLSFTQLNYGHILVLDITRNNQDNTMTLYDPMIDDITIKMFINIILHCINFLMIIWILKS